MERGYKYPVIAFILWVTSPILLIALLSFFETFLLNPEASVLNLLIPGLIFAVIAFGITKIKAPRLRVASFYALIGALIWSSPAIYFLPSSKLYLSLPLWGRFLAIIAPTFILSILLFIIGKNKENPNEDITDLYIKNYFLKSK